MMKSLFQVAVAVTLVLLFMGCGNNAPTSEQPATPVPSAHDYDSIPPADEDVSGSATDYADEREPNDEEIREFGLLTAIEDGPYPMFSINVEFPERQRTETFNINIEALPQDVTALYAMEGKYVNIYYVAEMENMLMDIKVNGKSLDAEYAPEFDPEWKSISGILSGAEQPSGGDLPDAISITDSKGREISFDTYITDQQSAMNGKQVTGYYYIRGVNTVTYLKASAE